MRVNVMPPIAALKASALLAAIAVEVIASAPRIAWNASANARTKTAARLENAHQVAHAAKKLASARMAASSAKLTIASRAASAKTDPAAARLVSALLAISAAVTPASAQLTPSANRHQVALLTICFTLEVLLCWQLRLVQHGSWWTRRSECYFSTIIIT